MLARNEFLSRIYLLKGLFLISPGSVQETERSWNRYEEDSGEKEETTGFPAEAYNVQMPQAGASQTSNGDLTAKSLEDWGMEIKKAKWCEMVVRSHTLPCLGTIYRL